MMDKFRYFFRRNSVNIAVLVIIFALASSLILQSIAYNKLTNGAQQRTKQYNQLVGQFDQLNRHMDCVVKFFSLKDRPQKAITEIESCRISKKPVADAPASSSPATVSPTPKATPKAPPKTTKPPKGNSGTKTPTIVCEDRQVLFITLHLNCREVS